MYTEASWNWNIKSGIAFYVLKVLIQELIKLISEPNTPKEAWDAFVGSFFTSEWCSIQLLENEIVS